MQRTPPLLFSKLHPTHHTRNPLSIAIAIDASKDSLFLTGLSQNALILYDLFESLGHHCWILTSKPTCLAEIPRPLGIPYKGIIPEDFINKYLGLDVLIEIGVSYDKMYHDLLRQNGAKVVKLYLGNTINIDVELVANRAGIVFPHHRGAPDEIWTSPHYIQNISYNCAINRTPAGLIVPYVWDSCFIESAPIWKAPVDWRKQDIVIMEPNVAYQKHCFYPLVLVAEFARRVPEWSGRVILMNSVLAMTNRHFANHTIPSLGLGSRLVLREREAVRAVMATNPSAAFICCQIGNEYNYMPLELMWCMFPVLHNSPDWAEYGYCWDCARFDEAVEVLRHALAEHSSRLSEYRVHSRELAWRHSPFNPENRAPWEAALQRQPPATRTPASEGELPWNKGDLEKFSQAGGCAVMAET